MMECKQLHLICWLMCHLRRIIGNASTKSCDSRGDKRTLGHAFLFRAHRLRVKLDFVRVLIRRDFKFPNLNREHSFCHLK